MTSNNPYKDIIADYLTFASAFL